MVDVGVQVVVFFFQAEDGIRDLVRSRGLGDVYKRQIPAIWAVYLALTFLVIGNGFFKPNVSTMVGNLYPCLLYTSDAADERSRCRSRWSPYP